MIRPRDLARHLLLDPVHALIIGRGRERLANAFAGEQILDLADRRHRNALRRELVEQRFASRRHGIVVAIGGALELPGSPVNGLAITRPMPRPSTVNS